MKPTFCYPLFIPFILLSGFELVMSSPLTTKSMELSQRLSDIDVKVAALYGDKFNEDASESPECGLF